MNLHRDRIRNGRVTQNVKDLIVAHAFPRNGHNVLVISDGYRMGQYQELDCDPNAIHRRDGNSAHACQPKSSATEKRKSKPATAISTISTATKHKYPTSTTKSSKPTPKTRIQKYTHTSSKSVHMSKSSATKKHTYTLASKNADTHATQSPPKPPRQQRTHWPYSY